MNFFAHLVVARRLDRDPSFLLGAMLPDFASMSASRLAEITEPTLAAGVKEHYRTDEAFHGGDRFVALCVDAGPRLERRGLSWGAARAIAHVGTELFLDGELAHLERDALADYALAVTAAREEPLASEIRFREPEGRVRFLTMQRRLAGRETPARYADPRFVRDVLVRILAPRPRLAVDPSCHDALLDELRALAERVAESRDALVGETIERMG